MALSAERFTSTSIHSQGDIKMAPKKGYSRRQKAFMEFWEQEQGNRLTIEEIKAIDLNERTDILDAFLHFVVGWSPEIRRERTKEEIKYLSYEHRWDD